MWALTNPRRGARGRLCGLDGLLAMLRGVWLATALAVPEGGITELSYTSEGFRSRGAAGRLFGELSG